jgi:glycosyltransferase involved in cell wall biosynthesis
MHDVQELHFPEYFTPDARAFRAARYWQAMKHASEVVVSFSHVKEDLIKYFSLPKDKIHVCPISPESIFTGQAQPADDGRYSEKYASWQPYLLYPAQTWRHKNHLRLLEALYKVRLRQEKDLRLICTGFKSDYYAEIEERIEKLNLREAVHFTGVLPEDELIWLYRHTALVVIPTEYEAGSYPLFEAMLQKAPVICSDVTSLPETIGDRRFIFDPYDVAGLADLIQRITTDENLRRENITNSVEQVQRLQRVDAAAASTMVRANISQDVVVQPRLSLGLILFCEKPLTAALSRIIDESLPGK